MYDIIIIGGGPSGLMAAIAAAEQGASSPTPFKVLLIDKGEKLGRKLGISGGGRCNVTNNKELDELIQHIPGNGRFLYSAFHTFNNKDIIAFFENLGIALKEEDRGRMFPVSDSAKTVVQALLRKVQSLQVEIKTNSPVQTILYDDNSVRGVKLKNGEELKCKAVIVATGGRSVPHTGSTGDGYPWAEAAGHTITELYPTEVPITSNTSFIRSKQLQGLSLRNITLTVWNPKGKKVITHEGDMIFTHFGVSGPCVLRCSQFVVKQKQKFGVETVLMSIDLFPELNATELEQAVLSLLKEEPKKMIKNVLKGFLPERLLPVLLEQAGIPSETTYDHLPKAAFETFLNLLKRFEFKASGTLSIEEAFVTGGGVHLKEIEPKTMASRMKEGLYFCGEILDIHGYTGGYNITAAFSTGYTAGRNAALWSLQEKGVYTSQ